MIVVSLVSLTLASAATVASASTATSNMNENSNLRGSSPVLVSDGSFKEYVDEASKEGADNNAIVAAAEDVDVNSEELADVVVPVEEEFIDSEAGVQKIDIGEKCSYNSDCYSACCKYWSYCAPTSKCFF